MRPLAAVTVFLAIVGGCAGAPQEASVRPGINDDFTNPALDVDAMVRRFETESREIFVHRSAIARAVGLHEGVAVADVGAGTGLFVDFFARDVGPSGRVFAVEIAPRFVDLLRERIAARGLRQVEAVLCTDRDVALAADSLDVVFTCDTYHHFEYPHSTLASIHRALRAAGELVIVDFERIPGTSRPWVLDHVRCGKQQVVSEVCAAGFALVEEVPLQLRENYFLRFRKTVGQARPS